jgi:response regulator of citrate/malate metabolism
MPPITRWSKRAAVSLHGIDNTTQTVARKSTRTQTTAAIKNDTTHTIVRSMGTQTTAATAKNRIKEAKAARIVADYKIIVSCMSSLFGFTKKTSKGDI